MTRDDALTVASMVASHWPNSFWNVETIDAYAVAIEEWDADLTMKALKRCVQEMERFPKVAQLRAYMLDEKRKTAYDRALEEAAVDSQRMPAKKQSRPLDTPEWVRGWFIARVKHKDLRMWPQQDERGHARDAGEKMMPADALAAYIEEGQGVPLEMILKEISGVLG